MSRWSIFVTVLTLVVAPAVIASDNEEGIVLDHDPSRAEMAEGRDLKLYDDGGDHSEMRMDATEFLAMRRFIWDHWRSKKRGYLRFVSPSSCDASTEEHIFIEPGDGDRWHIQFRTVFYWVGAGQEFARRNLHEHEIISLERNPPTRTEYEGKEPLMFRDKNGHMIRQI